MTETKTSKWMKLVSSFIGRFTLLHVITYLIFRVVFYITVGYSGDFAAEEMRNLMRPSDSPWIVASVFFQFGRGFLMAIALFPIKRTLLEGKLGWARLWFLLFILSGIGAAVAGVGSLEGMILTRIPLRYHFAGLPELAIQLLALSWLISIWENRLSRKKTEEEKPGPSPENRKEAGSRDT